MNKRARSLAVFLTAIFLIPLASFARQGLVPTSRQQNAQALTSVKQLVVQATDAGAELATDARGGVTTPLRFASPAPVNITPATDGTWEAVAGGRLWRLRVVSAGATDLSFGFSSCWLPDGATLHVYSEDEDYVQGPYESRDN